MVKRYNMAKGKSKSKNKKTTYGKILILIVIAVMLVFALYECPAKDKKDSSTFVVGYLPTWSYDAYKDLDWKTLTHVNIAFVNPDSSGNLSCSIPDKDLKKIVRKAHRKGVSVEICLGGGGTSADYVSLTSSKKSIKAFDKKIMSYLKDYKLDGVDLDIEGDADPAFWDNYGVWVKDLSARCKRSDKILSCAAATWYDKKISDKTFARFDYISVMAYDNKNDKKNHSTYKYAQKCLDYFTGKRDISPSRLVLGIPFYGYRYDGDKNTGKVVTYREVVSNNKNAGKSDVSGANRYNGIDTVKKKTRLAMSYKGVMVWALSQDASGSSSLLRAIGHTIRE